MKVEFTREEIVTKSYSMSLSRFMEQAFREAQLDKCDGKWYLRVGVCSGLSSGYLNIIYTIELLESERHLDFNTKSNVKLVLKRHLQESNNV